MFNKSLLNRAVELIDILQEKYPVTFPQKPLPKVPLALGTYQEIADTGIASKRVIKTSLNLWTKGRRYCEALSQPGAPRYNIHGVILGVVTKAQAMSAAKHTSPGGKHVGHC